MDTKNRILIVDDNPKLRKTIADILLSKGYAPTAVAKGKEALAIIADSSPAVALIDLKLEDMSGLELLGEIKNVSPNTECIVITGHASQASAIEAINLGAYSYLQKPYDVEQLLATIHRAVKRQNAQEAILESEERYRYLMELSPEAVSVHREGRFIYVNPAGYELYGASGPEELIGKPIIDFLHPDCRQVVLERVRRTQEEGMQFSPIKEKFLRLDGESIDIEVSTAPITFQGKRASLVVARDITERKQAEQRRRYIATHDSLTDLPNRTLFHDRLNHALGYAKRNNRKVGVLFLDLDGFKAINDAFGHSNGDYVLKIVAKRLDKCVRECDSIARLSSDEFAVLLYGITRSEDSSLVAKKLLDTISEPFIIDDREVFITTSIGISIYPNDGKDASTLLQNADTAVYRAKEEGKNIYLSYSKDMAVKAYERFDLASQLRHALEREELFLEYQPQVDLGSDEITSVEALLRWQHPDKGLILPARIIPVADETGLILPIGEWVLRTACAQNLAWQKAGLPPIRMAVNLSGREFKRLNLFGLIKRVLEETGLDPQLLELELTENIIFRDMESSMALLHELKGLGIRLAVDDFGTGYSTLSHLAKFPFDTLKIDQTFAPNITTDPNDAAIVGGIISIASNLGMTVIAEGVETADQIVFYKSHGCDQVQGWFYSHSVSAETIATLLKDGWQRSGVKPAKSGLVQ